MSLKESQHYFMNYFSNHDIDILKEMCQASGLNLTGRLPRDRVYEAVSSLELTFRNIDSLHPVVMFCNLTHLTVIGSDIDSLKGIETLTNLTDLWVIECNLKEISSLSNSIKLKKLYLYSNLISQMNGIQNCHHLEVLWLADNKISTIEGLEKLTHLKELNLAGNNIKFVGNSLQKNSRLENLNLTGNKLYFFRDLLSLMNLPKLKILAFADPQYSPCPVYTLCNYTTCIIYHFTKLVKLDGKLLLEEDIRKELEIICMKKLYYFMQMHMLHQKKAETEKKLEIAHKILQDQNLMMIKKILYNIKEKERVQYLIEELTNKTHLSEEDISNILKQNSERNAKSYAKMKHLDTANMMHILSQLDKKSEKYTEQYKDALMQVNEDFKSDIQFLFLEHETLGTVKFLVGKPSDVWFKACEDILLSRFCLNHYRRHRVSGIRMKRCIKIMNESLLLRFEKKIEEKHSISQFVMHPASKDYDFLFLIKNEFQNYSQRDKLLNILEYGVQILNTENSHHPYAVMLANSLYHADKQRYSTEKKNNNASSLTREGDGQPLVSCSCDLKSYEYLIYDPETVIPEFVIEFEYMSENLVNLDVVLENHLENENCFTFVDDKNYDEELSHLEEIPSNDEAIIVKWDDIIHITCSTTLTHLKELNLNGYQIKELPPLSPLNGLKKLTLSFNCLTNLVGISYLPNLELLDVSFNNLISIDGIQILPKLEKLDISFNKLSEISSIIKCLVLNASNIVCLVIHHNPLPKENEIILLLQKKLHKLKYVNNISIYSPKIDCGKNGERQFQVEYSFITPYASTVRSPPPCLCLKNMAYKMLHLFPKNTMPDINSTWYSKITTLELSDLSLKTLQGIGKFENLKWACFSRNKINSLADITNCIQMEELYLDHNSLTTLNAIGNMKELVRINVDYNQLKTLEGGNLYHLKSLQSFMASFNQISSLKGLECCSSLTELYLINNNISELNALSIIKNLKFLLVLMLNGNPITRFHNDYRYTVLFNVPKLLGLDGATVQKTDVIASKELLGGRLTVEFLREHMNITDLSSLKLLDLPNCSLLSVNLGNGSELPNLQSINLEHNQLTSFSGLIHLKTVKSLCLNFNHIESLLSSNTSKNEAAIDKETEVLQISNSLEVLHLAYNELNNLQMLQLKKFSSLKSLFLQGNKIKSLSGLEDLWYLEHLVLDRNEISIIQKGELESLCWLQELHIQENRLKEIPLLAGPLGLRKLYLGYNRINDLEELFKLTKLSSLEEISFAGNPVTRRALHRSILIHFNSSLSIIDGIKVSGEERLKANQYFSEGIYVSNESIGPSSPASDEPHNPQKSSELSLRTSTNTINFL